jgi:hypothetical protein
MLAHAATVQQKSSPGVSREKTSQKKNDREFTNRAAIQLFQPETQLLRQGTPLLQQETLLLQPD